MPSRGGYCSVVHTQSLVVYLETCMGLLTVPVDTASPPTQSKHPNRTIINVNNSYSPTCVLIVKVMLRIAN